MVDLETTGGSPERDRITEVGAVKVRGGVVEGTLQTFVNPGRPIPPSITVLTGITEAMVLPAPDIGEVLPTLLEFMGDAVVVGHNVRFDIGFLDAALRRTGRPVLSNRRVDTCRLARRLVRGEVPNCKLGTLAERFRLTHQPSHRALDDALATADLLHMLVERAAGLGVTGLDDLLSLPTMAGHDQATKLSLTSDLPRSPGVYLFTNGRNDVLYVGKATNLRARVRSYFSGDDRRKVGPLLRQTQGINHLGCVHSLEAGVREVRLIQTLTPQYNRHAVDPGRYRYIRFTPGEPDGSGDRMSIVRHPTGPIGTDGVMHLGPLASTSAARRAIGALAVVAPHIGTPAPGRSRRSGAIEVPGPMAGVASPVAPGPVAPPSRQAVIDAFRGRPDGVLGILHATMADWARHEHFEQAAALRDGAATLAAVLGDHHHLGWLYGSPRLVVEARGLGGAELTHGIVTAVWAADGQVRPVDTPLSPAAADQWPGPGGWPCGPTAPGHGTALPMAGPVPAWLVDELRVVHRWLVANHAILDVLEARVGPSSPWPRPPGFRMVAPAGTSTSMAA